MQSSSAITQMSLAFKPCDGCRLKRSSCSNLYW